MNKIIKRVSIIFLSLIIYVYVCNITLMPNNIIIFQGEDINLKTIAGISVRKNDRENINLVEASNDMEINNAIGASSGSYEINLDLFGTIPVKEINVNVIERTKVIPCGDLIGVKMYSKGALVVGFSEVEGIDNKIYKPFENTDINEGDTIVEINDKKISNNQGKEVFVKMLEEKLTPQEIVDKYEMGVIEDENLIDSLVTEVINENEKAITDYHNGRTNMLDYLVGQVMKKSKGKANPVEAKEKLLEKIN